MAKKIIFDIGHPAQVHQFSALYKILSQNDWECLFVAKDKEMAKYLLDYYQFNYVILSKNRKGLFRKIIGAFKDYISFYLIIKKFRPQFILHRFSLHASHISKLFGITNIGFSDTEHASSLHKLTAPFIDIKLTGNSYNFPLGKNHIFFDGNIELFYLHREIFNPNCDPYKVLNIKNGDSYCIVRFVSWEAHHDVGVNRMSAEDKKAIINFLLGKNYNVFISSESELPEFFKKYELAVAPEYMHTILKHADFYIGEGGTMASEAAVLNTPAIYTNQLPLMGYLREETEFNLLFHVHSYEEIKNLVENPPQPRFEEFMKKKINVAKFVAWFIQNYPESAKIMKENPDYQYRFK